MAHDTDPLILRQPARYLLRMLGFLAVTVFIVWLVQEPLMKAIAANPLLNLGIIAVLILGSLYTFGQVLNLRPEIKWLNTYHTPDGQAKAPRLLSPMARLLAGRDGALSLSPAITRAILDSIGSRLDETREIARYMIGLLIFLGLLGTFWGLLQTVDAVGDTIRSLSVGMGPIEDSFEELRLGLEAPLGGMGTAFSSSLVGLAGSLILGFLDLQMGQAQTRFYNDVEEWLSEGTQVPFDNAAYEPAPSMSSTAAMDGPQMLEIMQYTMTNMRQISAQLADLSNHMRAQQGMVDQLTEAQSYVAPLLERLDQIAAHNSGDVAIDALRAEINQLTQALYNISHGDQG